MTLAITSAGGSPADIADTDLAELPNLGSAFTETTAWRHELARLPVTR
jgi:3,4-dihydroxyphthalate decarboxylase